MEVLEHFIRLTSLCFFIGLVFNLLTNLFDWSKIVKNPLENAQQLRLFLILVSISLGFILSQFIWMILMMSRDFFLAFS